MHKMQEGEVRVKRAIFKYEEINYNRKQSSKHAIISIACMVASLYLAFMSFMMWFLSWWQFGIALGLMVVSLVVALKEFRAI